MRRLTELHAHRGKIFPPHIWSRAPAGPLKERFGGLQGAFERMAPAAVKCCKSDWRQTIFLGVNQTKLNMNECRERRAKK